MNEMVERVAVAILIRREVTMAECRTAARAAIEAMREPIEAIAAAAIADTALVDPDSAWSDEAIICAHKSIFRRLFDAALADD